MDLVIDAGNTRIKVATYVDGDLSELFVFSELSELTSFLDENTYSNAILSSVLSDEITNSILKDHSDIRLLDEQLFLPIHIAYDSLQTLGKDRLANAVYGHEKSNGKHALVIDLGTCIKFDFVTNQGIYAGGSISPGLKMRLKAMHHYTGKLPLIENIHSMKLIGDSTVNSMLSGVMNGIYYEIKGMIDAYKREFKDLIIFATGGDLQYFDFAHDMEVQSDKNLTINGLHTILKKQYEL